MSDISLTASMRSNLLSLQGTAKLMDRTQERLSSGKKVNSAIDNPSSYYTARSLNNRAGDLSALLDSMGQGISTIKAANEGIESITSFVEQAKAVVNSARGENSPLVTSTGEFSATEKKTYTFTIDGNDVELKSEKTGAALATEVAAKLQTLGSGWDAATANYDATTGQITAKKSTAEGAPTVSFDGYGFKLNAGGADVFVDTGTSLAAIATNLTTAAANLKDASGADVEGITFEAVDGTIVMASEKGTEVSVSGTANGITLSGTAGSSARAAYMEQFNSILIQITDMANDSGYKGVNLLKGDDLTVVFNEDRSSDLLIKGADATAEGLGLEPITDWSTDEKITETLKAVDDAINLLRSMASEFGNNYAILQNRENFTSNLINVLEEGADKLTLADMNEESANMLALQTRQQLAINSLSLASQAAQSVLRLFS